MRECFNLVKEAFSPKNIKEVSNLKPRFPFRLHNREGAEIRAAFLSDGHVPIDPTKSPSYSAYEEELHWRLIGCSNDIFGEMSDLCLSFASLNSSCIFL